MASNPLISLLFLGLVAFSSSQSTSFVDGLSKLVDYAEPDWFLANIPFLEVPDPAIEAVYYYRWTSLKRHLRYTTPGAGYIVTEFVHKVGYSQKFDTINAAAGHHIDEAKWLRDSRYVKVSSELRLSPIVMNLRFPGLCRITSTSGRGKARVINNIPSGLQTPPTTLIC